MLIAVEIDSALSSGLSLTLWAARSRCSLMSGQLRPETIHFTREDADCCATNSNSFGKSTVHSSSASITKHVPLRLGSCSTLAEISVKAT